MDPNTKYHLLAILGGGGLSGVLFYWLRAKIDVWRANRGAEVNISQAPVTVLMQIVQNKEKEAAELRASINTLITTHLTKDTAQHEQMVRVLTEQTTLLHQTIETMAEDRRTSAEQRKSIHERITQIAMHRGAQA